ncbi:Helicase POLQ-like [Nymphon striatum]|nr:Helicase POLQ-like [Nymphon striatum]
MVTVVGHLDLRYSRHGNTIELEDTDLLVLCFHGNPDSFDLYFKSEGKQTTKKWIQQALDNPNLSPDNSLSHFPDDLDRPNIKLIVKRRPPGCGRNRTAEDSYAAIFDPLVAELKEKKETFPKTMKSKVLRSMSDPNGQTKLLFATEAYIKCTDVPDIQRIVHAGPPTTLENNARQRRKKCVSRKEPPSDIIPLPKSPVYKPSSSTQAVSPLDGEDSDASEVFQTPKTAPNSAAARDKVASPPARGKVSTSAAKEKFIKLDNDLWQFKKELEADQQFKKCRKFNFDYTQEMKRMDPDYLMGSIKEIVLSNSCLIFCLTKKNCENVAQLVCNVLQSHVIDVIKQHRKDDKIALYKALLNEGNGHVCPILKFTLAFGVAYHHAGLTTDERRLLEEGYSNGTLFCLFCTSTLAAGVNLPAKRNTSSKKSFRCDDMMMIVKTLMPYSVIFFKTGSIMASEDAIFWTTVNF